MYSKGDKVVHPMYGAGIVDDIEEKFVDGKSKPYYILKIPVNNLKVSISVNNAQNLPMRQVHKKDKLMNIIAKAEFKPMNPTENWSIRYKENLTKVKSGKIEEVASVFKYLSSKESIKTLSSTEKKMMNSAKQIILSEIILSCGVQKSIAENILKKSIN
jgi:Transcriptional regulators, similar to M. xanthus CarD